MAAKQVADTKLASRAKFRGLTPAQIEAQLFESDDDDIDLNELYTPQEIAEAETEAQEADSDTEADPLPPTRQHERKKSSKRLVNSIEAALNENNFDPIGLEKEVKECSVKVNADIRVSKKLIG